MEFSLPAWLGGLAGTIVAVAIYLPGIRIVERRLRARSGPKTIEHRAAFEDKLSVVRRVDFRRRYRNPGHRGLLDRQLAIGGMGGLT